MRNTCCSFRLIQWLKWLKTYKDTCKHTKKTRKTYLCSVTAWPDQSPSNTTINQFTFNITCIITIIIVTLWNFRCLIIWRHDLKFHHYSLKMFCWSFNYLQSLEGNGCLHLFFLISLLKCTCKMLFTFQVVKLNREKC